MSDYESLEDARAAARLFTVLRLIVTDNIKTIHKSREHYHLPHRDDIALQDAAGTLDTILADHITPAFERADDAVRRLDPDYNTDGEAA